VRVARQLERDPVSGGDPDQRGAADRQAADGLGYVLGAAELELLLTPGQSPLVERPQRPGLEAERL
jgi:hypothetical protein